MNFEELIKNLELLNPSVEIRVGDPSKDSEAFTRIFSSVVGSQLQLPEGFRYDNNGINNRHHTTGGASIMIDVELLTKKVEPILLPKGMRVVKNTVPDYKKIGRVSDVGKRAITSLYKKAGLGKRRGI